MIFFKCIQDSVLPKKFGVRLVQNDVVEAKNCSSFHKDHALASFEHVSLNLHVASWLLSNANFTVNLFDIERVFYLSAE